MSSGNFSLGVFLSGGDAWSLSGILYLLLLLIFMGTACMRYADIKIDIIQAVI